MRSSAPALMPIFRSAHQAELLTALLIHPDRDYSVTELARQLNVPLTTLHREIQRLEDAGLLVSRPVGRSRLVRANPANRLVPPLTELLLAAFGPVPVISEEFADLGARLVAIFGSWAARYRGEPGPPPNDVDVLLVGTVDRAAAYAAAQRTEQRIGFPVNPTIISEQRWSRTNDPLVRIVKASPIVEVIGAGSSE